MVELVIGGALITFWSVVAVVAIVSRIVRFLRRERHDDELVFTVGALASVPRLGTLYPDDGWGDLPGMPRYRITRVIGCEHGSQPCKGWRAVYGVKVEQPAAPRPPDGD